MKRLALAITVFLSACSAPDDHAGQVSAFNGNSVTITGAMNQVRGQPGFTPTPAMFALASDTCGTDARFSTSMAPANGISGFMDYLFLC